MNAPILERWIRIRLRLGPTGLWLGYEDANGERRTPSEALIGAVPGWILTSYLSQWFFIIQDFTASVGLGGANLSIAAPPATLIPDDLNVLLRNAVLPQPIIRYGPHSTGPIPLPIFVDPPTGLSALPWEHLVRDLVASEIEPNQFQIVRLARHKWKSRPAFRLPIRVLAVGTRCDAALSVLRTREWYQGSPEAQLYGLQMETAYLSDFRGRLREQVYDVIFTDEESIASVLETIARLRNPEFTRPRLIVYLSSENNQAYALNLALPSGVSLLWVPPLPDPDVAEFARQIVYGIIHDCPLHEVLKIATRIILNPMLQHAVLRADPMSNVELRMADALTQLHANALAVAQTADPGDLGSFLNRMREDVPMELREGLSTAFAASYPITAALWQTRNVEISFRQESLGLVPLAEAEASLIRARQAQQEIQTALSGVLSNPLNREAVRRHQVRRVDMALDQLSPESIYEPVNPSFSLQTGSRYRLRLHIGHRLDDSLVVGEVPPLDPLLPEPEENNGHLLEVVVFPKDFTLLSPAVQTLYLPQLAGSQPVFFELQSPEREGLGEARVGIYHDNHLLQSFVVRAAIGVTSPGMTNDFQRQVEVRLVFSRTARFTNLDDLKPRGLSIAVNQNQGGATHTLMLKRDSKAESVHWTEAVISEQLEKYRAILREATWDPVTEDTRFDTFPDTGAPHSAEFADVIRRLADLGHDLHDALWSRVSKPMQEQLRGVARDDNQTLQVVRHDPTFAFPWAVLYDYRLPTRLTGDVLPPICLGGSDGGPVQMENGIYQKRCSHGPKNAGYCIYGFWGVRHCIEQLLGHAGVLQDAVEKIVSPNKAVRLAIGTRDDYTTRLTQHLQTQLGAALVEVSSSDEILDILWQQQNRPAVLIVIGHLENNMIDGEPDKPRIVLLPDQKWLWAGAITERHKDDGDWEEPHTLVLLLACGSAATKITTLNDFVTALANAGAAAVVGTEGIVDTSLVARFAEEVTTGLWSGSPLGEAVQGFNRRMVLEGNPLSFIFSYIGDADLTLVHS